MRQIVEMECVMLEKLSLIARLTVLKVDVAILFVNLRKQLKTAHLIVVINREKHASKKNNFLMFSTKYVLCE